MTELTIKKIEIGAEYDNVIYDYWVTSLLEDGSEIVLFYDGVPQNSSEYWGSLFAGGNLCFKIFNFSFFTLHFFVFSLKLLTK